eukprot:CAMPEP_0194218470 /NCGR_PEP_ID=MMETSP0156-20130528/23854_1 /TAXON_ID=33649 /ORGANISM="Thalassionema nitzschioides, Strain L26-B" /LENGTH=300 /DNA_ID=CAMNT_0038947839 /DNA_START=115 /DNA_END=1017 /DNA_ORIENTATION=+
MNCENGQTTCEAPDACANEEREEKLLASQNRDDGRPPWRRVLEREKTLIIVGIIFFLLLNTKTGRYVLYPFEIFTTWVHEMCHGTAALLMGGSIAYIEVYENGGGVCGSSVPGGQWRSAFVSSAGYPGATFWGCVMLLFRRTTLGPTIGMIGAGLLIILSVILYVQNQWGIIVLSIYGVVLVLCGWLLPAVLLDHLFAFLGVACSMNAMEDIQNLYGFGTDAGTDAHTVAKYWGGSHITWATCWLIFGIVMTFIGIVFARDAREVSTANGYYSNGSKTHSDYTATLGTSQEGLAYWKPNV